MTNYYNEIDPYAAQWLRNLITAGLIADGVVDERSITDVRADELREFTQCHFFAGIGVWSHALRRAGWSDDRPVWTGSCPCQPFSAAGQRKGVEDERHLWPSWSRLISECKPVMVFGEQVASSDGYGWLDTVQTDLEEMAYACGAVVLPAAGFGAPHGRHRIFFMANPLQSGRPERRPESGDRSTAGSGSIGELGHTQRNGAERTRGPEHFPDATSETGIVEHANLPGENREPSGREQSVCDERGTSVSAVVNPEGEQARISRLARERRAVGGFWGNADWIPCRDGKWRPVEPGAFPLAHGAASRVGRLRAYGNAISPEVAQAFIAAAMRESCI